MKKAIHPKIPARRTVCLSKDYHRMFIRSSNSFLHQICSECKDNEIIVLCPQECQMSCDGPTTNCSRPCAPRCECRPDWIHDANETCIPIWQCEKAKEMIYNYKLYVPAFDDLGYSTTYGL